jgi:hypothetical protein
MIASADSNNSKICKIRNDSKYANNCKIGIHLDRNSTTSAKPFNKSRLDISITLSNKKRVRVKSESDELSLFFW